MAQTIPPRYSPAELIAELREAAEEIAPELNGIRPEETLEGESAQTLEEMQEALRRIAAGAPNPQEIARVALSAKAPLRPFGKPRGTVVKMPKPKPQASKSDASKSDASKSDASRPNASKPNVSRPNVSRPKFPPKR